MKGFLPSVLVFAFTALRLAGAQAQLPTTNGYAMAPDDWLVSNGQKWHYWTRTAQPPSTLVRREPSRDESSVVEDARRLFGKGPARAMALVNGNEIVWTAFREPASEKTRLFSFSMGKTVNAMAVGKAICQGKLAMDTVAADLVPELKGKDLGAATVRDLLRMSSGTWEGNPDSTIYSPEQWAAVLAGTMSYLDILVTPKVSSAPTGLFVGKRKPGEVFAYRGTDPFLLGIMISRSTGTAYAKWVEQEVLLPAGIATPGVIGQDHFGYGHAEGNVRLVLDDWIRFAAWVKDNEEAQGCFGDFVRAASRTQIANSSKAFGKLFDGYGYLIWTENVRARDSYWARGHGGQCIGWNHKNRRILVAFSNNESYMDDLSMLYRDWSALP